MSYPLSLRKLTLALAGVIVSLLFIAPLLVYRANRSDFPALTASQFLLELTPFLGVAFVGLLAAMLLLLRFPTVTKALEKGVFFASIAAILFACYLPLAVGKLDGVDTIELSGRYLLAGLFAGGASLFFIGHYKALLLALLMGPVVVTIQVLLAMAPEIQEQPLLPFSSDQPNILLVSFDNVQSSYVSELLTESPERFDGFMIFPEVTAVAPFSALSTLTTKMGQLPQQIPGEVLTTAAALFQDRFISSRLGDSGFQIETYGDFEQGERSSTNSHDYYHARHNNDRGGYRRLLQAALLRVFPFPEQVNTGLDALNKLASRAAMSDFENYETQEMAQLVARDRHPLAHYKLDIIQFEAFISSMKSDNVGPTAKFHHYLFTHEPVRFDEDCNYLYGTGFRYVTAIPAETACAVSKMKSLINKLKDLAIYNNTMIIFTSDHGPECPLNFTLSPGSYQVSKRWCLSRYQPFLMIKGFNETGPLEIKTQQASLLDIAQTVCAATLSSAKCQDYEGIDLLGSAEDDVLTPRYILVSNTDKDERHYADFHRREVPRQFGIAEHFGLDRQPRYKRYLASALPSQTGAVFGSARQAGDGDDPGYITYGPYAHLRAGQYQFSVRHRFTNAGDNTSYWQVTIDGSSHELFRQSFLDTQGSVQEEMVAVTLDSAANHVELRTFFGGKGLLTIEAVEIRQLSRY